MCQYFGSVVFLGHTHHYFPPPLSATEYSISHKADLKTIGGCKNAPELATEVILKKKKKVASEITSHVVPRDTSSKRFRHSHSFSYTVLHVFVFGMGWSQACVLVPIGLRFSKKKKEKTSKSGFLNLLTRRTKCKRQMLRAMRIFGTVDF